MKVRPVASQEQTSGSLSWACSDSRPDVDTCDLSTSESRTRVIFRQLKVAVASRSTGTGGIYENVETCLSDCTTWCLSGYANAQGYERDDLKMGECEYWMNRACSAGARTCF